MQSDLSFMTPRIIQHNTPQDIRLESIRRMELYVLSLIERLHLNNLSEASNPFHAKHICKIRQELLVLRVLYGNVLSCTVSTQRDVYYRLVREVPHQHIVNEAIQRLTASTKVPREYMGVVAGARGSIAGALSYKGMSLQRDTAGPDGLTIPVLAEDLQVRPCEASYRHDTTAPHYPFVIDPDARAILVVEKHAVFYRLMSERMSQRFPCVILTSHGNPTHAARQLLHNLHMAAPQLPVVALADYNPSGLAIILQYKYNGFLGLTGGSGNDSSASVRAAAAAVPQLLWMGLRWKQIESVSCMEAGGVGAREHLASQEVPRVGVSSKPFTSRDTSMMSRLITSVKAAIADHAAPIQTCQEYQQSLLQLRTWLVEMENMQQRAQKIEIEAIYNVAVNSTAVGGIKFSFAQWVCQRLLRRDYI